MPRYIDADALYEKTAEWEARALAVVEKLNSKPLGEMDVDEITEWRKWSYILSERSAFKFDVADAPTVDVVERKAGKWIEYVNSHCECPFCHKEWSFFENMTDEFNYCPNCGAEMSERRE